MKLRPQQAPLGCVVGWVGAVPAVLDPYYDLPCQQRLLCWVLRLYQQLLLGWFLRLYCLLG